MKRIWLATLLLVLVAATGCLGRGVQLPTEKPFLSGVITKIDGDRVLVEATPGVQEGSKCWLAISDKTAVARTQNSNAVRAARTDLVTGLAVDAWVSGPVLESYPCQGGAAALLIK